ncbi:glycosyltransferase family 2 protein [Gonapodya prolifera JEL478]|uniref:Glycosyltransferase family 2 protein n=1 Tax=Gonapodya prolifera (strain JEL478) TaxID=1344416 RepID=A0A139ATL1_GONPJ|nr:glycosyltransferase family 2 protein [Gonapodya prolifera JEL478]|eukprot:KXS20062.1 glycosyltransferase family 2 protein [Gonapodya prolifera JEL478]
MCPTFWVETSSSELLPFLRARATSRKSKTHILFARRFRSHLIVNLIENMWFVHVIVILGCSYVMTFYLPQYYIDDEIWNYSCYWKLSWLLPLPYTLICFLGLVLPFRPAPTPDPAAQRVMRRRRLDNLYVCIVTRGSNAESVHRSYYSMRHLETVHPAVRVHVLTDEPYYYPSVECWSCPKEFVPQRAMYKARALEWYRRVLKLTEYDWILHLDEESVIDSYSLTKVLEFIWYSPYTIGQGPILYNHHAYWTNPFFTVADAIRVGDDIARFHLQYTYVHVPVFGAHGSFLLTNGAVENSVTWDVASLTEDYAFVNRAWSLGFRCGAIPAIVREQSPTTLADFLKQRRRWYVGIRRLPGFLPKLWNFFWTMGTLALYGTVASVILGVYVPLGTPRWLGAVKDFSFVVFVYLYVVGIFLQDVDAGYWPPKVILHIIATFFLQFVACVVECVAVMYAIFSPPAGFDVSGAVGTFCVGWAITELVLTDYKEMSPLFRAISLHIRFTMCSCSLCC